MNKPLLPPSVRLAIVDTAPHDYSELLSAAGTPGLSIHFLVSGNDAIRFARRWQTGLWVVNTRLGDMSGFDLAEMLRSIRPNALIFMIGDEYCLEDEMRALTLGMAKYLCKPLEPSWVVPQSDSCIPMLAFRDDSPSLRVVYAPGEAKHGEPAFASSAADNDFGDVARDILPFDRKPAQRPAA